MSYLEKIEKYWDMRSEGYSKSVNDELRDEYEKWSGKLIGLSGDVKGKKVLDIGCGPGFFTIIFAEKGADVTSFDYSAQMLKEAQKNVSAKGLNAVFMQGDAQRLPFDDESFDVIVSRNLTWNLEHPEKAYKEWLRVLKKGGMIINCDGNHYSHYYNDEYMLERTTGNFKDGHNKEYLKNIDVSIIDDIARDLPLSRVIRPMWDIDFLLKCGVAQVSADVERAEFDDDDGEKHSIIKKFVLKAVKQV